MKKTVIVWALAAILLSSMPAWALEIASANPQEKKTIEKTGVELLPIAKSFGCDEFAFGAMNNGVIMALEYVPTGHQAKTWTRMVTVTVFALKGNEGDKEVLNKIAGGLSSTYAQNAKIIKNEMYENDQGEPGLFLEYEMGEGAMKEHNAGIFRRIGANSAAFIQIQARGTALPASDAKQIYGLLGPTQR